ncbi:HTH-type transcriptional regulator DmlR [Achromobacter pestifer]|uniref:HTH-type transcriptional regulator DmlR n=2 Tax=Achromobacter pestifer TaxID=1353889 RepID=A0A6S6YKU4_9BURK|nr:HTH-type transcriptional regulator DmlR [Achromobacter pestifer]
MTKSAVSKRIADLETALSAQLFSRSLRTLQVTEAGQEFYRSMAPLIGQVKDTADSMVRNLNGSLHGRLHISAPMTFGMLYMGPLLASFSRKHPNLELVLDYDDRVKDLATRGYDVGVRIGYFSDSRLRARRLCECARLICCSPRYAEDNRLPATVSELAQHQSIIYAPSHPKRLLKFETGPQAVNPSHVATPARIFVNNGFAMRDLAMEGLGIITAPAFLVARPLQTGQLIQIPLSTGLLPYTVAVIYPDTSYVPTKVRAFVDHLAEAFAEQPPWETAPK